MQDAIQSQPTIHSIIWRKAGRFVLPLMLPGVGMWLLFQVLLPVGASPVASANYELPAAETRLVVPTSLFSMVVNQLAILNSNDLFDLAWSSFENDSSTSVAWGDYDNDGDLDLAVGSHNTRDVIAYPVRLYRNDHGILTASAVWSSNEFQRASSVAWGDYDGDGDLDLAVGNYYQPNRIYRNDNGTLTPNAVYNTAESDSTAGIIWADVDGDGDLDLTAINSCYTSGCRSVRLYRNEGGSLTTSAVWSSLEAGPTLSGAWADVDGDGDLDLAIGNWGPVMLYRNDSSVVGVPQLTIVYSSTENHDTAMSVAWGDVDGDGDPDLAVGNWATPNRVYRNDNGTLTPSAVWVSSETDTTTSVAWGDYDGDGDLDLAVGNGTTNGGGVPGTPNHLYRNDGGTLTTSAVWTSPEADNTQSVAWGDVDGDGDLDLAVANGFPGQPNRLYRNDGGVMDDSAAWSFAEPLYSTSAAWGDYDGDGKMDLAVGSWDQVRLYPNHNGVLTYTAVWSSTAGSETQSVAWGDYDGDGDLDLAVGNHYHPDQLYRNDGLVAGVLQMTVVWSSVEAADTHSIAWADYDGDGDLDLAASGDSQPNRLYRNDDGNLAISATWSSAESERAYALAWGDVDGDGDLDLAAANYCNGYADCRSVRLYRNDSGVFSSNVVWSSLEADSSTSLAWSDYDGDGDLDLVVGNDGQPNRLYRNVNGSLTSPASWSSIEVDDTTSVAWADYDNDGDLDLAVGNGGSPGQPNRLYRNDGGALSVSAVWAALEADSTQGLAWGDIEGDGDLDLVVANVYGAPNRVYYNRRYDPAQPGQVPMVQVLRPGPNAGFYSAAHMWSEPITPITYTLRDPQGAPVKAVHAWYSPNGGGQWLPAIAATNTFTTNLLTSGTALSFDGANDYITTTNLIGLPSGNVSHTVEAWIKVTSLPAYRAWLMVLGNPGFGAHHWLLNNDGTAQLGVWDSGGQTAQLHSRITPEVWTHVAMTFDGATLKGYVNGQLIGSVAATFDLQGVPLVLAQQHAGDNYFAGMLDEVRVWNVARTQAQIQAGMQQVLTGSVPGLVAYWRFNEGQGHTAFDQTSNHNTGTLVNGPSWDSVAFSYVYNWDTFASNFFGQSDNVVIRLQAVPSIVTGARNSTPGPYLNGAYASQTFPFRVRGTQVQVLSETQPISNASVYRLPAGQSSGGKLMADAAGTSFHTDPQGYLQGRGEIHLGDQLLALVPVSASLKYEGALQLDGLDDYVIKNPLNAAPITETTVSFWMRSEDTTGQGTPFSYATSSDADEFLVTNYNNLAIYRGNNISVTTGITATDGEWHHLAVTWRSADGQVKLYKDGVASYTGTLTATSIITGGSVILGQAQGGVGGSFDPARAFKGDLDEVHIWNVALDEAHIQADMLQPPSGSESGLVLDWTFDAPIDYTVDDQSGHGNAGTLSGATWHGQSFGGHTIYHTNGVPTETGLSTYTVTQAGVQTLTVTAAHPLILFDLDVSLEWDAHNDPAYLPQLTADLQRASAYLYDFSDGQIALGHVRVHQNADDWLTSQVVINATNRLRPLAVQGGSVTAPITDPQHSNIVYSPGQVRMGATWNRYGEPGGTTGSDWPLALAHELSHYLLFQEDAYLGVDSHGLLIPVGTCAGSAMGDMYDPNNTEFVFEQAHWNNDCADTLANRTLGRTEWATNRLWYPSLVAPTITNPGPVLMPFDWTTVTILDPVTPTNALADPTFFIRYQAAATSSSEARAFLVRTEAAGQDVVIDIGSPLGGQNRVLARGAQPGDQLCVFDQPRHQYGCEVIQTGDYELDLEHDETWTPVIQISPVNSQTIEIAIDSLTSTLPLRARLYSGDGYGGEVITLTQSNNLYSGTFHLDLPAMMGYVQVWVDETDTEANPRREAMVIYSLGGNPGNWPALRGGWPALRGGWPALRGGWSASRGSSAPLVSPGGQMLFFTPDPASIQEGNLYTIQSMAGLPPLPSGKTAVGQGYSLVASPNVTQVITGSISFQYLSIDVLVEQADEDQLTIHYWDGHAWQVLDTVCSPYFNMASAPSHGPGIYALLAGVTTPHLEAINPPVAINDVTTTLTLNGHDFLLPLDVLLIGPTTTYTLPVVSASPISITAIVTKDLPAHEYQVRVVNRYDKASSPTTLPFALYDPAAACFYDFFESGSGKWQRSGTWDTITLPNGDQALTDSPGGSYRVTVSPTLTATTGITSSAFNLGSCPNPVLTFRHDYVIDNRPPSQDWGRVEISTDDGTTWRELARYAGGLRTSLRKLDADSEWADAQWKDAEIDLGTYTGAVRLRFRLEFDRVGADRGWVIDNVMVYSKPRGNKVFLPVVLKG